jgi:SAM-dependent methyltransferase
MRNDAPTLRELVRDAYSAAARDPASRHPFPVGRTFAESIGYPSDVLDSIPASAIEGFAGVSNVALFADIPTGVVVLDVGCGAGLDALIAARRTGPSGRVVGVDFSAIMLERAGHAAATAGLTNLELRQADAERLPVSDGSIDVALVNGIFNLNTDRASIFRELARAVRPGGHVFCAELILTEPLPADEAACPTNWFA